MKDILAQFSDRLERVQAIFLDRATASLVEHLEKHGESTPWTYDPAGLRVLLSSSHKVLARNSVRSFDKAARAAAEEIAEIYARAFSLGPDDIDIALPRASQVPAPVTLGRTIALDLSAGWWKRWWLQRKGYKAYAEGFYDLIKYETSTVIAELRDDLAQAVRDEAISGFESFLNEQISIFETLESQAKDSPEKMRAVAGTNSRQTRRAEFERTVKTLGEYAAS